MARAKAERKQRNQNVNKNENHNNRYIQSIDRSSCESKKLAGTNTSTRRSKNNTGERFDDPNSRIGQLKALVSRQMKK